MTGEFRCCFYARDYEATLAFYREGLEFPVLKSWDRSVDDRGTLFGAASGMIEVLALPQHEVNPALDYRAPQGVSLVIEAEDVEVWYRRAVQKGLPVREELVLKKWGHLSFMLTDPNGVILYIFSKR